MPTFRPTPELDMHYAGRRFHRPVGRSPETILMLHGNAESGAAWYGWVPALARKYKVVRPDMRGFGASSPMPRDFRWTLDIIIDDYIRLKDYLGLDRCHLVGAKIGGTIARAFAGRRPERVQTLTVVGTPPPLRAGAAERVPELNAAFERDGVEAWARETMGGRLGSEFPAEGAEWWIRFMGRTAVSTQIGFMKTIACADIRADLPKIALPDPGRHHRRQRARLGRGDPRLAAADRQLEAAALARQFLSRRGHPCRTQRRGNRRFYCRQPRRLSGVSRPQTGARRCGAVATEDIREAPAGRRHRDIDPNGPVGAVTLRHVSSERASVSVEQSRKV